MKNNDKGFLLHKIAYSESSLIVRVLTYQQGVCSFIFKGAKKKKTQVLFPMSPIDFEFFRRDDSSLGTLSNAELRYQMLHSVFHPVKSNILFFQAEVLQNALHEGVPDASLFLFLDRELLYLEHAEVPPNYLLYWMLYLSKYLGFYPRTDRSLSRVFSLEEGDFELQSSSELSQCIEGDEVEYFWKLIHLESRDECLCLDIPKPLRKKMLQLILTYFKVQLPNFKDSKSLEIIEEIWYT